MDQTRRFLRVDHLPLFALQMTECNSIEYPRPFASTIQNNTCSNQMEKKKQGKIDLEACYIGSECHGKFQDSGALLGDVYDDIPDESDETVYDALEKAYNAAFSMSTIEKVERDQKYFNRQGIKRTKNSLKASKDQTTMENFDTWKESLLQGRKEVLFAVMKRKALDDIQEYKEYFIQQRQRKLNAIRNRKHENTEFATALWRDQLVLGQAHVIHAAQQMDEQLKQRKSVLRDLAKRCRDAHLKRQTRLKSKDAFDDKKLQRTDSDLDALVHTTGGPSNRPIMISRPRDILSDNVKLIQYLMEEADMFVELLLGNCSPVSIQNHGKTPQTLSGEEIVELAKSTSSRLFQEHGDMLAEYDADWNRVHPPSTYPVAEISKPPTHHPVLENPFTSPSDVSQWGWLSHSSTAPSSTINGGEQIQAILDRSTVSSEAHLQLRILYSQGNNCVFMPAAPRSVSHQISALLAELALVDNKWGLHLIITQDTKDWEDALGLLCPTLKVMTYWGSPDERNQLREFWRDPSLRYEDGCFHIVLTNFRVAHEDISHIHQMLWQISIYDSPFPSIDMSTWTCLLGVRCRQRNLIIDSQVKVDLRLLLHFVAPELFDTKQKVMAWGSAALEEDAIQSLRSIVQRLCVFAGSPDSGLDEATQHTTELCNAERQVLVKLNSTPVMEYIMAKPVTGPSEFDYLQRYKRQNRQKIVVDTKRLLLRTPATPMIENPIALSIPKPAMTDSKLIACKHCAKTFMTSSGLLKHTKSDHAPAGTWTCRKCSVDCGTMALRNAHERQEHDETITPSNKPSTHDTPTTPVIGNTTKSRRSNLGSKKRVTRCGKCAGCLSGDCMECGHCQDMKKYGGPGLRKQSCKNRKCTNPQVLGSSSQDDDDAKRGDEMIEGQSSESADSSESEEEEVVKAVDEDESEEEDAVDDAPLKAPKTTKGKRSRTSKAAAAAAASRTRVMRCGVCVGCLAPDCLKCRHCMDMKKYGGPGLRKQSCKSRKCITPKVVLLNQGQDEDGDMVLYDDQQHTPRSTLSYSAGSTPMSKNTSILTSSAAVTPVWEKDTLQHAASSLAHHVYQQMQLNRYLKVTCLACDAKFLNQSLKNLHESIHQESQHHLDKWKRQLLYERLALPAFQYTLISTDPKRKKQVDFEPVGYAKLLGPGLCYYMLQGQAILGRVASEWKDRYRSLGLEMTRGYPGGEVDCHLGDDMMISSQHAKIRWEIRRQRFVIECLSILTPLSVNGHEVHFGAAPFILASRSLIQVGAFYFYFLLPVGNHHRLSSIQKSSAMELATTCRNRHSIPRQEIYAWLANKKAIKRADIKVKRSPDEMNYSSLKRRKLNPVVE